MTTYGHCSDIYYTRLLNQLTITNLIVLPPRPSLGTRVVVLANVLRFRAWAGRSQFTQCVFVLPAPGGRDDLVRIMGGTGLLHSFTHGRLGHVAVRRAVMYDKMEVVAGSVSAELADVCIVDGGVGHPAGFQAYTKTT